MKGLRYVICFVVCVGFLGLFHSASAQKDDRVLTDPNKSKNPRVATILSAIVPGAGQIYNEKYWKVPVVYAGFGTFAYFINYNNDVYNKYKTIYIRIINEDETLEDQWRNAAPEGIRRERDKWRRWRDMNVIGVGVLYFLQIIDANVDAHLYDYDISDDLTLRCEPTMNKLVFNPKTNIPTNSLGVQLTLKF